VSPGTFRTARSASGTAPATNKEFRRVGHIDIINRNVICDLGLRDHPNPVPFVLSTAIAALELNIRVHDPKRAPFTDADVERGKKLMSGQA